MLCIEWRCCYFIGCLEFGDVRKCVTAICCYLDLNNLKVDHYIIDNIVYGK